MEDQAWSYGMLTSSSSSSTKFNHGADKTASYGFYDDYEEVDVDDELEQEFVCPFCSEDFDIVGLCCHIEEMHPVEAKKGICPICGIVVGMNLVDHVTMEHDYIQRRGDYAERESNTMSMLQKELDENDRTLESLLMRPPSMGFSSGGAADRMLTSFIGNYLSTADAQIIPSPSNDNCQEDKPLTDDVLERAMEHLSVNEENKEEKAQRCWFVQSMLFSTMLDDGL